MLYQPRSRGGATGPRFAPGAFWQRFQSCFAVNSFPAREEVADQPPHSQVRTLLSLHAQAPARFARCRRRIRPHRLARPPAGGQRDQS